MGPDRELAGDIGPVSLDGLDRADVGRRGAKQPPVDLAQQAGRMVGRTSQHHAIDMFEVLFRLIQRPDPAVDRDGQLRSLTLQPPDERIVERRHVAVLLGRQTLQVGLSRMHDEMTNARRCTQVHQPEQALLRVLVVDADAAFHGRRKLDRVADRGHALRHQLRLLHQAGAEPARLDPI